MGWVCMQKKQWPASSSVFVNSRVLSLCIYYISYVLVIACYIQTHDECRYASAWTSPLRLVCRRSRWSRSLRTSSHAAGMSTLSKYLFWLPRFWKIAFRNPNKFSSNHPWSKDNVSSACVPSANIGTSSAWLSPGLSPLGSAPSGLSSEAGATGGSCSTVPHNSSSDLFSSTLQPVVSPNGMPSSHQRLFSSSPSGPGKTTSIHNTVLILEHQSRTLGRSYMFFASPSNVAASASSASASRASASWERIQAVKHRTKPRIDWWLVI